MSGSVKKIFTVLIVMVACVVVGALVLNVLLPNVSSTLVDALEQMVFNATGMSFNWNNNGTQPGTGGRVDFTGDNSVNTNGNDVGKSGQVAGLDSGTGAGGAGGAG